MSGSQVARLAKPTQMRNHSTSKVAPLLVKTFVLSCTTTFGYYWFIFKAKKDAYRDFYANYDAGEYSLLNPFCTRNREVASNHLLGGLDMTPRRRNAFLFGSFQQLPRLRLGPLNGVLS